MSAWAMSRAVVGVMRCEAEVKESIGDSLIASPTAGPELTASTKRSLKLLAEGFHRPTARRGSDPLHFLGVERVARVLEVDELTSEGCFGLRGPRDGLGWGERFFQVFDHADLLAMPQRTGLGPV